MPKSTRRALAAHRQRLKERGLVRLEIRVPADDARLVRHVAEALLDPSRADEARRDLRQRFAPSTKVDLKALLLAAPLEGIDLSRDRDFDRDVEL